MFCLNKFFPFYFVYITWLKYSPSLACLRSHIGLIGLFTKPKLTPVCKSLQDLMCSMHLLPGAWNLFHAVHRTSSAHIAGDELVPGLAQIQSWLVLPGWSLVQEHQSIGACFDVRHSIFLRNRLNFLLPVLFKTSAIQFSRC